MFDDIAPRRARIVAGSFTPPLVPDPFGGGSGPLADGATEDLFGNGELGDVTIDSEVDGFTGGDYNNVTLGPSGVLRPPLGQGIVIRARGTLAIQGVIDASAVVQPLTMPGEPAALTIGDQQQAGSGGAGGGGGAPNGGGQQSFTNGSGGGGGANIGYIIGVPSSSGNAGFGGNGGPSPSPGGNGSDASGPAVPGGPSAWLLQVLRLQTWRIFVGGVGGAPGNTGQTGGQGGPGNTGSGNPGNGGNGGQGGMGGNGGGTIYLVAPRIILDPAAQLLSDGADGSSGMGGQAGNPADAGSNAGGGGAGGGGGGGQGGCGGMIYLLTQALSDPGPCLKTVTPGSGGGAGQGQTGGAGDVTGPAPNGQNGGSSGAGSPGCSGSVGIVFQYVL